MCTWQKFAVSLLSKPKETLTWLLWNSFYYFALFSQPFIDEIKNVIWYVIFWHARIFKLIYTSGLAVLIKYFWGELNANSVSYTTMTLSCVYRYANIWNTITMMNPFSTESKVYDMHLTNSQEIVSKNFKQDGFGLALCEDSDQPGHPPSLIKSLPFALSG